jgi:signal transduction histidine kinase
MSDEPTIPDLLRVLSHDLRSPVTALHLLLEAADRTPEGALSFDAELAGLFRTTVDELTALTDRLTAVSRAARAAAI